MISWYGNYRVRKTSYKSQLTSATFGTFQGSQFVKDAMDRFAERNISYDPIGNIRTCTRYAYPTAVMDNARIDSLEYEYYPKSNRLKRIVDHASHPMQGKGAGKFDDLVTQTDTVNYAYDAIGQLAVVLAESQPVQIGLQG